MLSYFPSMQTALNYAFAELVASLEDDRSRMDDNYEGRHYTDEDRATLSAKIEDVKAIQPHVFVREPVAMAHAVTVKHLPMTETKENRLSFSFPNWPSVGGRKRKIIPREVIEKAAREEGNGSLGVGRFSDALALKAAEILCEFLSDDDHGSIVAKSITFAPLDDETDVILIETRHREES